MVDRSPFWILVRRQDRSDQTTQPVLQCDVTVGLALVSFYILCILQERC